MLLRPNMPKGDLWCVWPFTMFTTWTLLWGYWVHLLEHKYIQAERIKRSWASPLAVLMLWCWNGKGYKFWRVILKLMPLTKVRTWRLLKWYSDHKSRLSCNIRTWSHLFELFMKELLSSVSAKHEHGYFNKQPILCIYTSAICVNTFVIYHMQKFPKWHSYSKFYRKFTIWQKQGFQRWQKQGIHGF